MTFFFLSLYVSGLTLGSSKISKVADSCICVSSSGEKRTALLAEVAQLRAEVEPGDAVTASPSQEPCRGTVTIANIQLPLKVDFVCSSLTLAGMFLPHPHLHS